MSHENIVAQFIGVLLRKSCFLSLFFQPRKDHQMLKVTLKWQEGARSGFNGISAKIG